MEKDKAGVCTTCNMGYGSNCSKWCAGCTLHKLLRVVIMVVALCVTYAFGEQVGMLKAMILSDSGFMPHQNMMYRNNWGNNGDQMMMQGTIAPTMQAAPAAATATKPVVKK